MVHRLAGINAPASEHLLSEPAIVARLAQATLGTRSTRAVALAGRGLRPHPRPDRAGVRRLPRLQRARARARRLPPARTPRASASGERRRQGAVRRASGAASRHADARGARATAATGRSRSRPCARTTSTTPRSTASTTAIAAYPASAACCSSNADDIAQLGLQRRRLRRPRDRVGRRRASDARRRFLLVDYDIPRGCLAAYYPETNPLVPLSSYAERRAHADVEVDSGAGGAARRRGRRRRPA